MLLFFDLFSLFFSDVQPDGRWRPTRSADTQYTADAGRGRTLHGSLLDFTQRDKTIRVVFSEIKKKHPTQRSL